VAGKKPCWEIAGALDSIRHYRLVTDAQARSLRALDPIEQNAGRLYEHRPPRKRRKNKAKRR
jgi:hypothetical protein